MTASRLWYRAQHPHDLVRPGTSAKKQETSADRLNRMRAVLTNKPADMPRQLLSGQLGIGKGHRDYAA